jgi:hypothetical protein
LIPTVLWLIYESIRYQHATDPQHCSKPNISIKGKEKGSCLFISSRATSGCSCRDGA